VRKDGALFGPARTISPHASITRQMGTSDEEKEDYREKYKSRVKASLPKKDEAPVIGMRSNKNFITANAVEAILQGIVQ
jgi:hypothetical protein